jgi:hypothetical protein
MWEDMRRRLDIVLLPFLVMRWLSSIHTQNSFYSVWHSDTQRSSTELHCLNLSPKFSYNIDSTTNSMEQSTWKAKSHSASQEIPHFLWNPNVYCRVHNMPPLVLILIQIHPAHSFTLYLLQSHSNIILPPTLSFFECLFPPDFPINFRKHFLYPQWVLHVTPISSSLTSSP